MEIFDFLKGGNEKVFANDIIRLHHRNIGDFDTIIQILNERVSSLERQNEGGRKGDSASKFYAMGGTSLGNNYAHCGGQILYYSAAPSFAEASDIIPHTAEKIASFLRQASIPENHISGRNDTLFPKLGLADKYTVKDIGNACANVAVGHLGALLKDAKLSGDKVNAQFLRLLQTEPAWLESTRGWQAANAMVTLENAGRSPMAILQNRLTGAAQTSVSAVLATYLAPVSERALGEIASLLIEGGDRDDLNEIVLLAQKNIDEFMAKIGNEWRTW